MKRSISAPWIIGLVFSLLGGLFLILGLALLYGFRETEVWMVGAVFALIGSIFFIIGLACLTAEAKRRKKAELLMERGRYVWGEVIAVVPNRSIHINNRNPFYAAIRHTDPYGKVVVFRSPSSMELWHREDLVGRNVRVYLGENPRKDYYVDIAGLLE